MQRAVDLAPDGGLIWLYADLDAAARYEGAVLIDKRVTIESAPGEDLRHVVLSNGEVYLDTALLHIIVDGVTLRRFTIEGRAGIRRAISAQLSAGSSPPPVGFSRGHLFEQLYLVAVGAAIRGQNSTEHAIFPGGGSVVRNCFFGGWWGGVLELGQAWGLDVDDVVLAHNTAILVEPWPALRFGPGSSAEVRNNVLVTLNAKAGVVALDGAVSESVLVEGNAVWGYDAVASGDGTAPWAAQLQDPGLVDMTGPDLASDGAALSSAQAHASGGSVDLFGVPRPVQGTVPAGALANTGTRPPLPLQVRVGLSADACDDALGAGCHFFGTDAIARAVAAARPGSEVLLYGSATLTDPFIANGIVVDRPLSLVAAPSAPLGSVVLTNTSETQFGGMVVVTQAENVRIAGLIFLCQTGCHSAVWFDPGLSNTQGRDDGAEKGVIDRCYAQALVSNGVEAAFALSHFGQLRNSVAAGDFEALAAVHALDARVVGNTFVSTEPSDDVVALRIGDSRGLRAVNNLLDLTAVTSAGVRTMASLDDAYPPQDGIDAPIDELFLDNFLYGATALTLAAGDYLYDPADGGLLTFTGNCVAIDGAGEDVPAQYECDDELPGFADPGGFDFTLSESAQAVGEGNDDFVVEDERELFGAARIQGAHVDVGARER